MQPPTRGIRSPTRRSHRRRRPPLTTAAEFTLWMAATSTTALRALRNCTSTTLLLTPGAQARRDLVPQAISVRRQALTLARYLLLAAASFRVLLFLSTT